MLNRLPKGMPTFEDMLYDIGNPPAKDVAKVLGVHERTIKHWIKHDKAPRLAMLSVFWLTKWGHSAVDAEVRNLAQLHIALSQSLKLEVKRLQDEIERMARLADFGSANDPSHRIRFSRPTTDPVGVVAATARKPLRREAPSTPAVPRHVPTKHFRKRRHA
jgi:hypothetical protein